jgi:hypothetical protein
MPLNTSLRVGVPGRITTSVAAKLPPGLDIFGIRDLTDFGSEPTDLTGINDICSGRDVPF